VANVSAVRRRYNDFQWLYERLHLEKPGAIIPVIPHKRVHLLKTEAKFTTEFVSERRAILEDWINRILVHPELTDAASLAAFMKQDDELFASSKKANDLPDSSLSLAESGGGEEAGGEEADEADDADASASGGTAVGKQRFTRIRRMFAKAAIKSGVELAKVEDEEQFADIDKYATELEKDLAILVKQSSALTTATKTSAAATHEIAKAFSGLSENTYPTPDLGAAGRLAAMLNNAAKGMLSLSSTIEEKATAEIDQIEASVHDFERDVQALRNALQRRQEKHYDLTKKLNRITAVGAKLDRMKEVAVNKTDENAMIPIQAKEGEMIEAKEAAEAARAELEVVSARVVREVERFRLLVHSKLRNIIAEMGGVAVRFDDKINDAWGTILANTQPSVEPKFDAV
jgi:sorting nexin-1/2